MLRITILALLAWGSAPGAAGGDSAGSTLFLHKPPGCCWSRDDIARLRARRAFEKLALPAAPPDRVTSAYIQGTLRYYKRCLRKVDSSNKTDEKVILKQSLADTIGAHLTSNVLPNVRLAFYAGLVTYQDARKLHDFLDEMKLALNTQGIGWKAPTNLPMYTNISVAKISIAPGLQKDPCALLQVQRDSSSCLHLPPPRLDDARRPAALALPLRAGGVVSLVAPAADGALLKYYTAASRCLLERSTERCRHADFVHFNAELWHWLRRDVAPRLPDEKLYTAFGGVLRVTAAVQAYGRGLTRRNAQIDCQQKDPSLQPFGREYCNKLGSYERGWVYIYYVLAAAFAIWGMQVLCQCFFELPCIAGRYCPKQAKALDTPCCSCSGAALEGGSRPSDAEINQKKLDETLKREAMLKKALESEKRRSLEQEMGFKQRESAKLVAETMKREENLRWELESLRRDFASLQWGGHIKREVDMLKNSGNFNRNQSARRINMLRREVDSLKREIALKSDESQRREESLKREASSKYEQVLKYVEAIKAQADLKRQESLKREELLKREAEIKLEEALRREQSLKSELQTLKREETYNRERSYKMDYDSLRRQEAIKREVESLRNQQEADAITLQRETELLRQTRDNAIRETALKLASLNQGTSLGHPVSLSSHPESVHPEISLRRYGSPIPESSVRTHGSLEPQTSLNPYYHDLSLKSHGSINTKMFVGSPESLHPEMSIRIHPQIPPRSQGSIHPEIPLRNQALSNRETSSRNQGLINRELSPRNQGLINREMTIKEENEAAINLGLPLNREEPLNAEAALREEMLRHELEAMKARSRLAPNEEQPPLLTEASLRRQMLQSQIEALKEKSLLTTNEERSPLLAEASLRRHMINLDIEAANPTVNPDGSTWDLKLIKKEDTLKAEQSLWQQPVLSPEDAAQQKEPSQIPESEPEKKTGESIVATVKGAIKRTGRRFYLGYRAPGPSKPSEPSTSGGSSSNSCSGTPRSQPRPHSGFGPDVPFSTPPPHRKHN